MATREISSDSNFGDRLSKLVPAEFVAAYLAIHNLASAQAQNSTYLIEATALLIMIVALPFYQIKILKINSTRQIIATCVSFILWSISIGSPIDSAMFAEHIFVYKQIYGTISMILWTLVSPLLFQETD